MVDSTRARPQSRAQDKLQRQNLYKEFIETASKYAMVGVNIIAAGSDDEARKLATTQQMSFTNIFSRYSSGN
jgi:hypothetical protein